MPESEDLRSAFQAALPGASPVINLPDLEPSLQKLLAAARAAWPDVSLDPAAFVRYVAERLRDDLPPLARAGDLYIACACALGNPAAVQAFQGEYRRAIARAVATIDASSGFSAEIAQTLGLKLFAPRADGPPGIVQYRGRSALRTWLATAAVRTALNLKSGKKNVPSEDAGSVAAELGTDADPELLLLKAKYKTQVEASIRAAFAALTARQRSLLLLQAVDGLTLPQLARMHRVSRATVARWLASARASVFEATRRDLVARLGLTASECDSLVGLVRSQIELSLATMCSPAAAHLPLT
jgi:RNA polymerase sigma-70 factor (ECF subfamily)